MFFANPRLTHADDGTTVVQDDTVTLQTVPALTDDLGHTLIEGVTERNVSDNAALEVSPWADTLGAVDDLVRDNKVARLNGLLETTDGRKGDDTADTDRTESSDVGTSRNLVRGNLVVETVTAQERDRDGLVVVLALVVQDGNRRGGLAPGS